MTCPTNSVPVDPSTNRLLPPPYAYDANGNMTNDGTNTLAYDAASQLITSTNGGNGAAYVYDGHGIRIRKCAPNCGSPTSSTIYIFSGSKVIAEYDNGAAVASPSREYIYSGAQLLAKSESGALTYYHSDHLSNRATTDSSGNVLAQRAHYPFGETWYESGTASKLKFTTYERDSETGNDFAMARYAVSGLGRFSSPDALAGSALAPQSMNRFSYVQNDPINAADPSGLVRTPWGFAFSEVGFGSSWNEFDLIPVYGYSFQMVHWSSSTGEPVTTEEWSYGIVGYMQDPFGPGELPGGIPLHLGPLGGPPPQPKSPFLIFLESMSQDCIDALNQAGLLGIIDAMASSLKIFDINAISEQLARNYAGPQVANQTIGSFFGSLPDDAARTLVRVPQPGIYVRGGAGRFDGGDNMYWLLHEASHLAYPQGPNLDISLAGRLQIPYTDGANGASGALSKYFNSHCDPSLRTSKP